MTQNSNAATPSQRQEVQALVSAAMSAQRTGNSPLAEQLLEQVLELQPDNADAMQLMGLIAKSKGNFPAAEQWMRKSLAVDNRQAHVHNNLGNLLKGRGDMLGAIEHYGQAVALKPDYAEALVHYGEALMAEDRLADAERPVKKAFRLLPGNVAATCAMADWHHRNGDQAEAEKLLRAGMKMQPDNPFYRHNLGLQLAAQQRYAEGLDLLMPLIDIMSDRPELFVNIGNALVGVGRLGEAVNYFLKAINLEPQNNYAHEYVNNLLWQIGRKEDVGKSFLFARQAIPDNPDILEMAAACLLVFSRYDEVEADLEAAARLRPGTPGQYRLWTALRLGQLRPDEAIALASVGLQHEPEDRDLLRKLIEACLLANRPAEALQAARRLSALDLFDQEAAAYEATALRLLGETEAARRIYDYERLVHRVELALPDGYGDFESYHATLAAQLEELHHARNEPVHQSLRNGTQTHENLFGRPGIHRSVSQLGESVMAAAERFLEGLPDDPHHPFIGRKGSKMAWSGSWSVLLREGGFHTDHIHPKGWISGVYYIDMPDCVADEQQKPGWIKFGEYRRDMGPSLPWEMSVRPQPGLLVLFPSYMWHGTLPVSGSQRRLTVAFDIAPAAENS